MEENNTQSSMEDLIERNKRAADTRKTNRDLHLLVPPAERLAAVENVKRIMRQRGINHMQVAIMAKFPEAKKRKRVTRTMCVKPMCPHKAIKGEELCPRCKAHQSRS